MITLFLLLPVVFGVSPYWKMHNDVTSCQEKDTACKMSSGDYGCCPAVDGVCCADGEHCCPSGFECDLSTKQCVQYGDPALYVLTEKLLDVAPIGLANVQCPGGGYCTDGYTCCLGTDSKYHCCTIPHANCCDDYTSCCPSGTVCDVANGKCITPFQEALDRILLMKPSAKHRL